MRLRLALSGLLVAALALGGCGSEEPGAEPPSSPSASPTVPPGLDVTEPQPPSDQDDTEASAIEFGRYLVASIQYADRIRDVTPLVTLARDQGSCSSCRGVSRYIEGLKEDEVWETGEAVEVGTLRARRTGPTTYTVKGPAVYPRVSFVDIDGKQDYYQVESRYRLDADLVWDADRDRWQVEDFAFVNVGRNPS